MYISRHTCTVLRLYLTKDTSGVQCQSIRGMGLFGSCMIYLRYTMRWKPIYSGTVYYLDIFSLKPSTCQAQSSGPLFPIQLKAERLTQTTPLVGSSISYLLSDFSIQAPTASKSIAYLIPSGFASRSRHISFHPWPFPSFVKFPHRPNGFVLPFWLLYR